MSGQPSPAPGRNGPDSDDLPRRMLAAAAALTPASRRDWGQAMLNELDLVAGRRDRWLFALGAVRAALVPPSSSRSPAIVLAAAAIAAAIGMGWVVPQAGALALVTVPGLPALCAWLALAAPQPALRPNAAGRAVQAVAVAGIIACPVLGIRLLALYPGNSGTGALSVDIAIAFAVEIAVFLVLVLRRPEPLRAGRGSGLLGLAGALIIGGVYLDARLHNPASPRSISPFTGLTGLVVLAAVAVPLAAAILAAIPGAIKRAGIERWLHHAAAEAMWTALLSVPAAFIVFVLTISRSTVTAAAANRATAELALRQGATSVTAAVASDYFAAAIILTAAVFIAITPAFLMMHGAFLAVRPDAPETPGQVGPYPEARA